MNITNETLKHTAKLAKLGLAPAEETKLTDELGKIIASIEVLNTVDTKLAEPTHQVITNTNITRDDVVKVCENPEEVLACSPLNQKNAILVPKVK